MPTARFQSLKHADVPSKIRELQRSKQSFSALAENDDWLANNFDKIIHSQGIPPQDGDAEKRTARETVAENEERILRCLGAAVIMQCNTIPTSARLPLMRKFASRSVPIIRRMTSIQHSMRSGTLSANDAAVRSLKQIL